MMTDCREDPCGECRYCRFEAPVREAELPTDGAPLPDPDYVLPRDPSELRQSPAGGAS